MRITSPTVLLGPLLLTATLAPAWAQSEAGSQTPPAAAAAQQAEPTAQLLPWLGNLAAARRAAVASGRPILVRIGGPFCPWCKKLEAQIEEPAVQRALAQWTLVAIDVDRDSDEAQLLRVSGIPALRVLSPQGRLIAAHDGFLAADELVAWLAKQREEVARAPDELLLGDQPPTLLEVVRLVQLLPERDAAVREAAIRRLAAHPQAAAAAIVNSLGEGNLASRLAAIEVLGEWKAPLVGIDPWRPDTVSAERLAALERWAEEVSPESAAQFRTALTPEEKETAAADIERMLKADEAASAALRERLARLGPALLPEVAARQARSTSDQERQRLTVLRYRLAAGHGLAIRWPGGLERLADRDVAVRHQAADELAGLATAEHEPLLLELFSDPDPLVREISLRGLKNVSGNRSASALARLLDDPDPNVRAAVLKQLAEDATGELVGKVADYLQRESDADLIVHALRYFGEVKDRDVTESVLPLLEHKSWQVRAEAAQVLVKLANESRYTSAVTPEMVTIRRALVKLLEDEDAFVVSRALEGLERVNSPSAVDPLVRAVERHPALSPAITKILANNSDMQAQAVPYLRRFLEHENPAVRAAAIAGLCQADADNTRADLKAALADPDSRVRIAAADSLVAMLRSKRPGPDEGAIARATAAVGLVRTVGRLFGLGGGASEPAEPAAPSPEAVPADTKPADTGPADAPADKPQVSRLDAWLGELYAGQHRAAWTAELGEPLAGLLAAESHEERAAAALALVPLGRADAALPVLLASVKEEPGLYPRACQALKWLPWPQRKELFERLDALARHSEQRQILLDVMNEVPDRRAAGLYWQLLGRPDFDRALGDALSAALEHAYFGSQHYDSSQISAAARRQAREEIVPQAESGPAIKRLVAINLLLEYAADEALAAATKLLEDPAAPAELRADAFQLVLLAQAEAERTQSAVAALTGDDPGRRRVALRYLAGGAAALTELPATAFRTSAVDDVRGFVNSGQPIIPEAPARVEAGHVRSLLADSDPEVAAYAGYLLCLLGEPEGLDPLLAHWRSQEEPDESLDRLVYRAISVLDDSSRLTELRTIAGRIDQYALSEFYWTVRIMSGQEILQFRKELRDKHGVENLR